MSGVLILRALLFAAECFLASALLPLAAFGVAALLRRRAALRHLTFTTMFGVLAVLPLAALLLPPRRIVEHVVAPAAVLPAAAPVLAAPLSAAAPPAIFTLENIVLLLAALWLAGLAWQLLRLGVGGLGLMRLRRRSAPFALASGRDVHLDMRLAPGAQGPSTFGIFRPIVLLPQAALSWPSARLEAVLRHEAAHVVRRDTASQLLARLVCALYWPNPLIWLAARAARRAAEIAADDAVLASGMTPSLYAAELLGLAAEANGIAPGIAMARPPLTQRVQAVLADDSSRKGVSRMDIAKTVSFGLAATLLLGAARFDIAVAQDAPPPPPLPPIPAGPPVPAAPSAEARMAQRAAEMDARVAAVKAKAEATAARAQAKADAETDPVKKAQYAQQAAAATAQSAQAKVQGDMMRAQMDQMRVQMAQFRPQLQQALANARVGEQVAKALADAHIDETISKALADAHLDATTRKAIQDAHIEDRIREAMAQIQPRIEAAMARAQRQSQSVTIRTMPPDAPMPALPPPPPLPEIAPVPPAPPPN